MTDHNDNDDEINENIKVDFVIIVISGVVVIITIVMIRMLNYNNYHVHDWR